jgi:hypothetical protein
MAKARLREAHQNNLRKKLEMLKAQQGVEEEERAERAQRQAEAEISEEEEEEPEAFDVQVVESAIKEYDEGRYTPAPVDPSDFEPGTIFLTEEDDTKRLDYTRQQVLNKGRKVENVLTVEEKALQREARKGMTDDEASFGVEVDLEQQSYLWSDKYRPRKPRYFNRVHTGFEWNKYNQTHYDMDNPPPKIVQGYKFNIFYPDLLDKSTTPQYEIVSIISIVSKARSCFVLYISEKREFVESTDFDNVDVEPWLPFHAVQLTFGLVETKKHANSGTRH